ncbi:MAG: hypothetical protein WD688_04100 [Candidatus Binatia bacterium]
MNEIAVAVSVILFPGLISTVIADKITVHSRSWGSFKYSIYSFVFGVLCYVTVQILIWLATCLPEALQILPLRTGTLGVWSLVTDTRARIDLVEVFAATVLAVPVAFLGAFLINYKIFHKLAQKLRISRKYGDENLYSYYLNAKEIDWVYVRDLERKLTYQGRVVSFSENDRIQELVLSDVTVYAYDDSTEYYSIPSIYLCREMGQFVIEAIPAENMGI